MLNQPMIILFVDFSKSLKESERVINEVIPEVAKALYRGMVVAYSDEMNMAHVRVQFGIPDS